jgi:hypothetical protein
VDDEDEGEEGIEWDCAAASPSAAAPEDRTPGSAAEEAAAGRLAAAWGPGGAQLRAAVPRAATGMWPWAGPGVGVEVEVRPCGSWSVASRCARSLSALRAKASVMKSMVRPLASFWAGEMREWGPY